MTVKLKINEYNDRRTICGLLADNGYSVRIEKTKTNYDFDKKDCYVILETNEKHNETETERYN